jgi:methylenetetrahydrofolate reductase (NADPH)
VLPFPRARHDREVLANVDPDCPKRMAFGPCGGVRPDLSCEMAPVPCPFARRAEAVTWSEAVTRPAPASSLLAAIGTGQPVVLTDLTVPPYDATAMADVADVLRGSCDAVLVGEHQSQPDFPPTMMAELLRANGLTGWLTLTCRDRNRVVLEQELAGLRLAGVDGVLCVTGDGRAPGVRADVTQVFDLDGTRLAALAASLGHAVAVAESPSAAPRHLRAGRLLQKQRAGADLAILNHVGSVAAVRAFLAAAAEVGARLPVVAAVAVYTDALSAQVLTGFPGLDLDLDVVAGVLASADPERAGIDAAVAEAEQLLALDQVVGVNLSGLASSRGLLHVAAVKAEIGRRVRGTS